MAGFDVVPSRVEDPVAGAIKLARRTWSSSLVVDGAVENPGQWNFEDLAAFPESEQIQDVSRFPSRKAGDGVTLESILARVKPSAEASYLTLHSSKDDFHVSVPLGPVRGEAVIVYALNGSSLPESKGGPFRFLIRDPSACHTSELDDCANVKFLDRIELSADKGVDTRPQDETEHAALHASQGG